MSVSRPIPEEWLQALISWAEENQHVTSAYLYGSRVKGTHGGDSDLDVAVRLGGTAEDPFTTWACEAEVWRQQLARLLPVSVHLELAQMTMRSSGRQCEDTGLRSSSAANMLMSALRGKRRGVLGMITSLNLIVYLGNATLHGSNAVFTGIEGRAAILD